MARRSWESRRLGEKASGETLPADVEEVDGDGEDRSGGGKTLV